MSTMPDRAEIALRRIGAAVSEVILLCDALDDIPLWVKDVSGRYQWVNRSFLQNFGFEDRDEVLGRTDFDLCAPLLAEQYRVDDERVLGGERISGRIELVGRYDHTARWCVTNKIPLHNPSGRIVGTAGVTRPLAADKAETPDGTLGPALRLISERAGQQVTNVELARACGLSVRAFERQFRSSYGCAPQRYARRLRVRMTCHALVYSAKTLAAIAAEWGFADQSHFTREFRYFLGITPGAYRRRHRP